MKSKLIMVLLTLSSWSVYAQQTLELDTCIAHAYQKLEYDKITQSYNESAELAQKNASTNWYPSLDIDGTFTYQNENINIPITAPIPGFTSPVAPLNINRVVLNISQTIYDGSVTANVKKVEQAKYDNLKKQVDVDKAKIKAQVTQLFITINLMDANTQILTDKKTILQDRLKVLNSAAKAGSVPPVNIKMLQAELMNLDQVILEAKFGNQALRASLSEITGLSVLLDTKLVIPVAQVTYSDDVTQRAELQMLDLQMRSLDAQRGLTATARLPKVSAFASVGAGNPGYDIFKESISPMAMVGVKLKWNVWDWNKTKNSKQVISVSQQIISTKKSQATTQFVSELRVQQLEIEKYKMLLQQDENVVKIRQEITEVKAAELTNGTITTTAYLEELNKENEAKLNVEVHRLKLVMAQLNYLIIQGK
tara:strand:+ start:12779 stop:14047 length:1269 start_codon:yes stop_codon:yes gene_type:complete